MEKWHKRFLGLAEHIAQWSKDPSTKCGAVITKDKQIISTGFNGYPKGIDDSNYTDRKLKYAMVLHAECNAILYAKTDLKDCSIYVSPMPPCSQCTAMIIQSGIKEVFTYKPSKEKKKRWQASFLVGEAMLKQANVKLWLLDND